MRSKIGMLRSVIKLLSDPIEPDLNCALESLFSLQFHFMYCIHFGQVPEFIRSEIGILNEVLKLNAFRWPLTRLAKDVQFS